MASNRSLQGLAPSPSFPPVCVRPVCRPGRRTGRRSPRIFRWGEKVVPLHGPSASGVVRARPLQPPCKGVSQANPGPFFWGFSTFHTRLPPVLQSSPPLRWSRRSRAARGEGRCGGGSSNTYTHPGRFPCRFAPEFPGFSRTFAIVLDRIRRRPPRRDCIARDAKDDCEEPCDRRRRGSRGFGVKTEWGPMDRAAPPGPVPSGRASEWRLCWICYPGIRGTPDRRRRQGHGQLPSTHETTRRTGNRSRGQRRIPLSQRPPRLVFLDGITADFPLKPLAAREAEHRFTPLTAPVDEGERTARMTVGGLGRQMRGHGKGSCPAKRLAGVIPARFVRGPGRREIGSGASAFIGSRMVRETSPIQGAGRAAGGGRFKPFLWMMQSIS